MQIDLIDNYNKYFGRLNSAVKETPELHLTRQVEPEISVKVNDSYNFSFAAQARARIHANDANLQKLAHKIEAKTNAHGQHVDMTK